MCMVWLMIVSLKYKVHVSPVAVDSRGYKVYLCFRYYIAWHMYVGVCMILRICVRISSGDIYHLRDASSVVHW